MLKMIDVLEQNLVQNFSDSLCSDADHSEAQFHQKLREMSEIDLANIVSVFFLNDQAADIAQALDISAQSLQDIQAGAELKAENLLATTAKIVAYCLAIETDALNRVEIADCLQDYPM